MDMANFPVRLRQTALPAGTVDLIFNGLACRTMSLSGKAGARQREGFR
jgi:hypothetical protein